MVDLLLPEVGGMRDESDEHSGVTAVREVVEETGLVDICHVPEASRWSQRHAAEVGAPKPLFFQKFAEGAKCDWWVLLLDGEGLYEAATTVQECADISNVLHQLPGASVAPCFGHAWLPVQSVDYISEELPLMGGLQYRIKGAAQHLQRARPKGAVQQNATARQPLRPPGSFHPPVIDLTDDT
eukprot:TRINITY_DN11319_c0_g1_i2.p1 TRINITY_DN11319_c0_g1~~TRINITY_DN11319_c0_g1_i2.p1  ORF type:complete len:183 (+),score=39.77 TRINITY_DN11319_c0_g1_i2:757-1305(+)